MLKTTPKRLLASFVLATGLIAPVGLLQAATASADTPCATEIVDDANLYKGDLTQVQQAVDALKSEGADVRVRTINGFAPYPSLDSYLTAQRSQCKGNWSNDDGTLMKGNLVVLGISNSSNKAQRALQLYYGSDWDAALLDNGEALRIQTSVITPYLRNGDYAGGTAAGLGATGEAINSYLHPPESSGGSTGPTFEAPDLSGLWKILGWLFAALVLGALGFFGYRVFSERRDREAERVTARGEALRERDAASAIIADLHNPTRDAVRESQVATLAEADPQLGSQAHDLVDDYNSDIDNAETSMARAATSYEGADNDKLTTEQYQSMTPVYADALRSATAAQKTDDKIKELYKDLQDDLAGLPQTIDTLKAEVARLQAEVSSFVGKGYRANGIEEKLGSLSETVYSFGVSDTTMQLFKLVSSAVKDFDEIQSAYTDLSSMALSCVNEVAKLPELVASARTALPKAQDAFARVSTTYSQDSWKSVAGNGSQAEKRFSTADDLIAQAQQAASLDSQKWDEAYDLLGEIKAVVADGEELLAAIMVREVHLAKAKETAQSEIDAAQRDIDMAADFEHTYDDDIRDSLRDDIAKARELLDQARTELAETKPNYLRVVDLALQANKAADAAYAQGASEHDAAERLRQQAITSVQLAEASVSKAELFISNHASDVDNGARNHLNRANDLLASAEQADEPAEVVRIATDALDEARSAYKKAENDFNSAQAERERIREEERQRLQRIQDAADAAEAAARRERQRQQDVADAARRSSSSLGSGSGSSTNFGGFGGSSGGSGSSTSW